MALFQSSVLKKYLKLQNDEKVKKAYRKFSKYFHDPIIQENIKSIKEEEYQGIFLTELFVHVLGYTLKPNNNYNLVAEFKNQTNSRKADGAILKDEVALGVIELKGTKTKDLDSITRQAFDYKANQKGCVYIITSNFEKLRFYINDATEFMEFNLFELSEKDFSELYLCLYCDNLLKNLPQRIKRESLTEEEEVTKKFYKDYSQFKRELYRDLVKRNAKALKTARHGELKDLTVGTITEENLIRLEKNVKLTLFKKSQKLIDRFLFIFFAEDRGLLTPNSTIKILNDWDRLQDMDTDIPLYDRFKLYFKYLDTGRKGTDKKDEIFAYNGGLFKPDGILDSITIDDQLLYKHSKALANYDFSEQVDVNILGHIFENSLNEIESVNAEIEGGEFDKQKSKRKKDGVFYTPKYITKYIVENTVGKLCQEQKEKLDIKEEEYYKGRKNRNKTTIKRLVEQLDSYREWLLKITICDPACGSGAFLNQALDFLINEHSYIDELKSKVLGGGLQFPDIETTILENNIFGVDLNEESVEIAKLSLWLRTAQPRRKLNDLSSNIKCGNSLIESKAVAGDKAFVWEEEFAEVFANGGFDVVIGNPPYVRVQTIKESIQKESIELERCYQSATRRYDLFVLFIEKSYSLIKLSGVVSYILPHKFLIADFGYGIRKFLKEKKFVESIISFGHEMVFSDASTYTCILTLSNNNKAVNFIEITPFQIFKKNEFSSINYEKLDVEKWNLVNSIDKAVLDKITLNKLKLSDLIENISQGIKNTSDKIFMLQGDFDGNLFIGYSEALKEEITIEADILKPVAKGKDIKRYDDLDINYYQIYTHKQEDDKTVPLEEEELSLKYPLSYRYLLRFKDLLIEKKIRYKTNPKYWYSLHRSRELKIFDDCKIVSATIQNYPHFTLDKSKSVTDAGGYCMLLPEDIGINKLQLLGVLNSKVLWFFIKNTSSVYRGGYFAFNTTFLSPFPLPELDKFKDSEIEKYVVVTIKLHAEFNSMKGLFIKYFNSQFQLQKLSKKLQKWYELEFGDFIKELNKAIKTTNKKLRSEENAEIPTLNKKDEFGWLELFEENKKKAQELRSQIDQTEKEIDAMVYDLYGLTEEEIAVVENS